jgi:hypothetical protein
MTLTSEIFKTATDFLSDLAINFAKKGIQKLTKPLIEEMVKEYSDKQPKNPSNTTIIIDNSINNSIDNSINITEEVFSIMQIDKRFVIEDDYITVEPVALQDSQTYFSEVELWTKLIALQETIKRRKFEQEQERVNPPTDISENLNVSPIRTSSLLDDNMKTTIQNLPPAPATPILAKRWKTQLPRLGNLIRRRVKASVILPKVRRLKSNNSVTRIVTPTPVVPKLQRVSESKVTVELSAPDIQTLKLLQPAKPIEPLTTHPEIDDSQDKQPLSRSDYLKQKVSNMQSRIKVRKIEQGEE